MVDATAKEGETQNLVSSYITAGKPLDFTFLKIQDVEQLKTEDPRVEGGKRKPVIEVDEEDGDKKNDVAGGPVMAADALDSGENKQKEEEKLVRAPQIQEITKILQNFNVPLANTKNAMGSRKADDVKVEQTKKMVVRQQTQALFLQNNEIRTIANLYSILGDVMYNHTNMLWLDLSYNYLTEIESELQNFKCLKTLYLHGNYITCIDDVKILQDFGQLQTLTLFGNPIEQIKGYRMWVLGVMYEKNENLRRFDQVLITKREFDNVIVWTEYTHKKESKKLKKLKIADIENSVRNKPPAREVDEEKATAA